MNNILSNSKSKIVLNDTYTIAFVIYKYKYPILITTGFTFCAIFLKPLIKSYFSTSTAISGLEINPNFLSLHLPENEFLKNLYLSFLMSSKSTVVLGLTWYTEIRKIVMYKLFGETIEEGLIFYLRIIKKIKEN